MQECAEREVDVGEVGQTPTRLGDRVAMVGARNCSPLGNELAMSIESSGVLASEATVSVASLTIEGAETELDLADVDIGDRITEGTIFLEIENPFSLTGNLTVGLSVTRARLSSDM